MKERLTLGQLREIINGIDPKFDDYSIGIYFADNKVDDDIVVDFPKDPVLSPTADTERQARFTIIGRREWDKMMAKLEEFNKYYEEKYGKKEN